MENAAQHASALFSDATSEQLLQSGSALIADALSRLSIKVTTNLTMPSLTPGYFICEYDRMPWDMDVSYFLPQNLLYLAQEIRTFDREKMIQLVDTCC